ncbi:MAG TPA: helix-turn-helix domain-containing protein [Azospirillum sp.]|nr:helix-turn-helix domain-containing protein [Azospirillum sp.]
MSPTPHANAAPAGRRERKLAQTSRHVAERAWGLFEQFGYEQVTMEAIANAADVARGTLYKHFPTKESLVAYRFRQDQIQGRSAVQEAVSKAPNIVEAFLCVLRMEAGYAERNRSYVAPYVFHRLSNAKENPDPFQNDEFAVLALRLIRQGQEDGVISTELDAQSLAENIIFLRLGAMLRWLREPEAALADLYTGMLHAFFHGALQRPQPE